jgi:DNA-binding GntR family transcriptional regulator
MPPPTVTAPLPDRPLTISIPQASPTLYEQVYASILEAICGGALRPGDRINQDDLAASLQVSRQPVTQALTVLRAQDFVQDAGRRGLVVTPLRRGFFESLYELRESLDPVAARRAAGRSATLARAPAQALLDCGHAAVREGSVAALTSADMAFHIWVYEAAGNPLLTDTLRLYWHHLRRAMAAVIEPPQDRGRVWDEHERILDAVLRGDPQEAQRLSAAHVREASRRVMDRLPASAGA